MRSTYLDLMKMEWHPSCFCVAKIVCSAHQIATSPWVPLQLLPPPLSAWPCSSVEPTFLQKPKKNREHQFKAYVHMYGICGYLWMIMASQRVSTVENPCTFHAPKIPPRLDMLPRALPLWPGAEPFEPMVACRRLQELLKNLPEIHWESLRYCQRYCQNLSKILSKCTFSILRHQFHPLEIEQAVPAIVQKEQKVTIANLRMLIQEKQRSSQIFCITRHLQQLPRSDFWWGHRGRLSKNTSVAYMIEVALARWVG